MQLIIAVDAIFPPLTGIGRYAAALVNGLTHSEAVDSLRFFAHGKWVDNPLPAASAAGNEGRATLAAQLRVALARKPWAVRAYSALTPRISRWRLRNCEDALFHSPNFILPPFPGISVATVHDLSTELFPQFHPAARVALMQRTLPATAARADCIITPSEAVRREVITHFGVSEDRVRAIPMGVDEGYSPRTTEALDIELEPLSLRAGTYVLCVATMEPRKNIGRLLDAWERLPPELRAQYTLVLAGPPGWNSEALLARVRALQARGDVRHLGWVPEQLLPALYAGARLFAFPALYEGFGLPVLEAMASGVPVVTSNTSSLPEVAGGAALLVEPLSVENLSTALKQGLEDDNWREQAIAAGLARAAEHRWSHCVDRTIALYRELLP